MAEKDNQKDQDLTTVDNVEVSSLTDEDLDTVAGGMTFSPTNNATTGCGSNAANACC
jgi:hypothetical protein